MGFLSVFFPHTFQGVPQCTKDCSPIGNEIGLARVRTDFYPDISSYNGEGAKELTDQFSKKEASARQLPSNNGTCMLSSSIRNTYSPNANFVCLLLQDLFPATQWHKPSSIHHTKSQRQRPRSCCCCPTPSQRQWQTNALLIRYATRT